MRRFKMLYKHTSLRMKPLFIGKVIADERQALAEQERTLSEQLGVTKTALAEARATLQTEQARKLTQASVPELNEAKTEVQGAVNALRETLGGIKQQLTDNEERKSAHQDRQHAIAKQTENLAVWQKLHQLIGSSDGKKYRNFAQGLTFDVMIGYANVQLSKMTNRYVLLRDESQPLELNVLDNFQGRSSHHQNLSGGEGFIVSLAWRWDYKMASGQTGRNISVDSLFLDEGFGTLDADSFVLLWPP